MKRASKYIWTAVGAAALLLVISWTGVSRSVAQAAQAITLIRDADNAARHPFQVSMPVTVLGCALNCYTQATLVKVPAGKRLVIQQVSVIGYGYPNVRHYARFYATTGGILAEPAISLVSQGVFDTSDVVTGSISGPMYGDAGTDVLITLYDQDQTAGEGTVFYVTVTGYYVSA